MALALAPILMLSIQRYPAIFELYLSVVKLARQPLCPGYKRLGGF
jgi:hypothetical protein